MDMTVLSDELLRQLSDFETFSKCSKFEETEDLIEKYNQKI